MAKAAFKTEAGALTVATYASALVEGERALVAAGQELLAARLGKRPAAGGETAKTK